MEPERTAPVGLGVPFRVFSIFLRRSFTGAAGLQEGGGHGIGRSPRFLVGAGGGGYGKSKINPIGPQVLVHSIHQDSILGTAGVRSRKPVVSVRRIAQEVWLYWTKGYC